MGFGERFNEWLIQRGREPLDADTIAAMNEAAEAVGMFLQKYRTEMVQEMQRILADHAEGKEIDPEARAQALLDRLEAEDQ